MAARRKKNTRRGRGAEAPRLWPPKLGMFLLRVYIGLVFFQVVHHKIWASRMAPPPQGKDMTLREALADFSDTDYLKFVRGGIEQPPVVEIFGWRWEMDGYAWFLENVMLPGKVPYIAGAMILGLEFLVALSLVFGIGVRLMAFLGALLLVALALARNMYFFTVGGTNWLLAFSLLALSLTAAGRIFGFDARLKERWPGWIS